MIEQEAALTALRFYADYEKKKNCFCHLRCMLKPQPPYRALNAL
jgi:hypothetical protein